MNQIEWDLQTPAPAGSNQFRRQSFAARTCVACPHKRSSQPAGATARRTRTLTHMAPQNSQLPEWLTSKPKLVAIGVAAGTPLALYWLWSKCGSDWFSQPVLDTDFDSFLVQQGEHPTGLGPSQQPKKKATVKRESGAPFEAFLLSPADGNNDDVDTRDPLDFSSFLKTANTSKQNSSKQVQAQHGGSDKTPAAKGPSPDQARVLVMFGTEYGFSKEIAEKLCAKLHAAGKYWPALADMAEHPEGYDFAQEQAVLVACSTQGDGVPPTEARDFCDWLFAGKAGSLSHLKFSVIALGDKSYQHFCRCGKQIDAAFEAAGAQRCYERVDVNKEDWQAVDSWIDGVVQAVAGLELKPVGEAAAGASHIDTSKKAAVKRWGKSRPYPARVLAVEGLCKVSLKDDKNTMRVAFDLSDDSSLTYQPGDALGIYPANAPQYVDELLHVMGAAADQQVPTPSWHYDTPQGKPDSMSLKDALTLCYDLKTPRPELFQLLWDGYPAAVRELCSAPLPAGKPTHVTNGHANGYANGHANGVHTPDALTNGHAKDQTKDIVDDMQVQARALSVLITGGAAAQEAYLDAGRHVVDALRQFSSTKLSVTQVLSCLRQLQPRLYSISSAPQETEAPQVQATIAEVKYQALDCPRIGVCSTYVSERIQVGEVVPVYIHKNPDFRLPPSLSTPIIMVGPGTGLAPFRSFILHRLIQAGRLPAGSGGQTAGGVADTKQELGEMVLFFGCRRSDQDYLYGSDLESWAAAGHITLHTAFSRQQAHKVYVQDRLREQADAIWQLLNKEGAHFYVCGDAANMAGAVEEALLHVFKERLQGHEDDKERAAAAQAYLQSLSSNGRYQRDVWY